MLNIGKRKEETYAQIMEAALRKIPRLTEQWDNLQEYDPGVTILELLGWLTGVQRNYMEQITEESQKKFLTLLQIPPLHNHAAHTLLAVDGANCPTRIPSGTGWTTHQLHFENPQTTWLSGCSLLSVVRWDGVKQLVGQITTYHMFQLFGEEPKAENWFCLQFDKPLPTGQVHRLYFENGTPFQRNPVTEADKFCPLAQLCWQYHTNSGWHTATILREDTQGFLFSGIVEFLVEEQGADCLRVTLCKAEYDIAPSICAVLHNIIEVEQRETLCACELRRAADIQEGETTLESNLALYGAHMAYRKQAGEWHMCEAVFEPHPEQGMTRALVSEGAEDLMVISYGARGMQSAMPINGTGISYQQILLKERNLEYDIFSLMVATRGVQDAGFTIWNKTEDFFGCDKESQAYHLDTINSTIRFGDHAHGIAPYKGQANIRLCSMALTAGAGGNLQANLPFRAKLPTFAHLKIHQVLPATGGRGEESLTARKKRCISSLQQNERAVTVQDYIRIVQNTPGLLLRNLKILPGAMIKEGQLLPQDGAVTVVVDGHGRAAEKPLYGYIQNIKQHLEAFRLVNVKVEVVWPERIALIVGGWVRANHAQEDRIRQQISDLLGKLPIGAPLYYGELFGQLDALEGISLESLFVLANGKIPPRSNTGDVLAPPNGIYLLKGLDFTYTLG